MIKATDYESLAEAAYQTLKARFITSSAFWTTGNSFDTIIDYFHAIDTSEAAGFAATAIGKYTETLHTAGWYDDYGWWGIAARRAAQLPELFPEHTEQFAAIAESCFRCMDENATNVWDAADKLTYADYGPRFGGGVWNWYWTETYNPRTQASTMQGIQNSVTNGLYLVLSTRLALANPENAHFSRVSAREYAFLRGWCTVDNAEECLLRKFGADQGSLLRERVSSYASGKAVYPSRPDLCWLGDQGLILGGLTDRLKLDEKTDTELNRTKLMEDILTGVLSHFQKKDHTLAPWIPAGSPAPGGENYRVCYVTGQGIFFRYLLYAYRHNAALHAWMNTSANLHEVLHACATAKPDVTCGDEMTAWTNTLAASVAAAEILKNA